MGEKPVKRMTHDAFAMDDGLAFLQGELEWINPEVYEVKYRNLRYADLVPVSSAAGPLAEAITYETLDRRTKARFVNPQAKTDVPLADVTRSRETTPVEHAALGYEYTLQELRQAAQLRKPLDVERARAVQRGVDELAQEVCFVGSAAHGLPGFLNNTDIPAANATTGSWTVATDPDLILGDINELITGIWDTSKTIELVDTLLLPPTQFGLIATMPRGTVNDTTVMEFVKKANVYTVQTGRELDIQPLNELAGLGAGATDRMVAYKRSPEVVTFHFPMPLEFLPPQAKGLGFLVPGQFRLSGVEVRYPLACGFSDGI
jgi:hypothetical protein